MQKDQLYAEYGAYHADPRNRFCHWIGIPLIVMGVLGLLAEVGVGPTNLALLLGLATLIFYATLDLRGAVVSALFFAVLYLGGSHTTWLINLSAFVTGWGFQLMGHAFEGKKPKFLENLVYLLIGPLYLFASCFRNRTQGRIPL